MAHIQEKNHAKNHFDWMKTKGPIKVWSLLYNWMPGSGCQVNLILHVRFPEIFFHFHTIYFGYNMKKSSWNTFSDVWLKKSERPVFLFLFCQMFFLSFPYYLIWKVRKFHSPCSYKSETNKNTRVVIFYPTPHE